MPFTPSHAVVALPFVRTPLVPAAIAIGAMTPDLPLFVRLPGVTYAATHALGSLVWTTLIALALFVLWRVVLRPAAAELSPRWLAQRLPGEWWLSPGAALRSAVGIGQSRGYPLLLVVSAVLGILSHIAWDAFTHEGRAGLALLPALAEQWGPMLGYKWLQHGSSVLGLVIVGVWALRWVRRQAPSDIARRTTPRTVTVIWLVALPVILAIAWIMGFAQRGPFTAAFTPQHLAYATLPAASGVWAVLTLLLCLALLVRRMRRATPVAEQKHR